MRSRRPSSVYVNGSQSSVAMDEKIKIKTKKKENTQERTNKIKVRNLLKDQNSFEIHTGNTPRNINLCFDFSKLPSALFLQQIMSAAPKSWGQQ